jgi:hypothetical protein
MSAVLSLMRGEIKIYQFTVTENGSAVNLTGASMRFALRKQAGLVPESDDAGAVLVKTTSDTISLTDPTNGVFEITFNAADTKDLVLESAMVGYMYGIEYKLPGDTGPRALIQDRFILTADVVRGL